MENNIPNFKETYNPEIDYDDNVRIASIKFKDNKIINEYKILKEIGQGSYSKVKLTLNMQENKYYVLINLIYTGS